MKNLSIREKLLLGLLVIFMIGYLYYSFFLSSMLDKISESEQANVTYNAQLENIADIIKSNDEFKVTYDKTMQAYSSYWEMVPNTARDPEIAYSLQQIAGQSSCQIMNMGFDFSAQQVPDNVTILSFPVTLDIRSTSFESTMKMIRMLEEDDRIAQIKSLNMTKSVDQTSGIVESTSNIQLEYYYMADDAQNTIEYDFNQGSYGNSNFFK